MAFLFTLLYVGVTYLSPAELLPSLAPYRIQLWIAALAVLCSIPTLLEDREWRVPQVGLFAGFLICIPLSQLFGPNHWAGGALQAVVDFLPSGIVLPLVILNCRSITKLKALVVALLLIAAYFVIRGAAAYSLGDLLSKFIYPQRLADGTFIPRIRALSSLNDPNDFAQFILSLLPLLWLLRRGGNRVSELIQCAIPTAFLVWGLYLTHSRGALVAAAVTLLFVLRRRLGMTSSAALAAIAVGALFALDFTGGRAISLEGGADRLDLWGTGLTLFKSSPLVGIGYSGFIDAVGGTAHNSFVLCLAELGLIGFFCWIATIVFTFVQLNEVAEASPAPATAALPDPCGPAGLQESETSDEIKRLAFQAQLSLIAFLAAGWFLSRTYTATFWLILGIGVAVVQIAKDEGVLVEETNAQHVLKLSAGAVTLSVACVYAMLWSRSIF